MAGVYAPAMADSDAQISVTRETSIAASPGRVFDQLDDFHNWRHWSPWEDVDPDLQREYIGPAKGPGAAYAWKGNRKAGEGRMEVLEAVDPEKVAVRVEFLKPFKSQSLSVFTLTPEGDGTHVDWTMTFSRTLVSRVMSVFTSYDKMVGPDFEKGLARLKAYAEGRR
jgi:uncharacterized protein YndB with AHSA1/START domain